MLHSGERDEARRSPLRTDKEVTAPLNLSADTVDDKRAKRCAPEMEDPDQAKRVKGEQTEATDLSMKPNSAASQNRPGNHAVQLNS